MIKVSIKLDKRRRLNNGKFPLKFRVTRKGATFFIATGYELREEDWDDSGEKVKNLPDKRLVNTKLKKRLVEINEKIFGLQAKGLLRTFTNKRLASYLQNEDCGEEEAQMLFKTQMATFLSTKEKDTTKIIYRTTERNMMLFCDYDNLRMDEIDIDWLNRFVEFLKTRGNKVNSIATRLRNIRAVLNFARKKGVIKEIAFSVFSIKEEDTPKRSLTVEQLRVLYNEPLAPSFAKHRDIFFLIFFLMGINIVDLAHINQITDGRIRYRRSKTGTLYDVKVEPEAEAIIGRYSGKERLVDIFDHVSRYNYVTSSIDKALKIICADLKLPPISVYWARHTFATIAYEIGISIDVIADCLGHKSNHRVTAIYIKRDQRRVDEANRRVIDYVLYNKK